MVSTLMHLVWSASAARFAGIRNLERFLFFGTLLDLDFILNLFFMRPIDHRDYFHNVFFIFAILFAIWLMEKKKKNAELLKSASLAFFLHILLDLFDGTGVPIFFPLSSERILIYPIGAAYNFPLKLFWEGNIYFTSFSVLILFSAIYLKKHNLNKK